MNTDMKIPHTSTLRIPVSQRFKMAALPCLVSLVLAACGGGGGSSSPTSGNDTPTDPRQPTTPSNPNTPTTPAKIDIADVYDASKVAPPAPRAANNIANPGFEGNNDNWRMCNMVNIVNHPDAPSSNRVVQFTNKEKSSDISRGCGGDYDVITGLQTPITLDPNATHYTLSFKAYATDKLPSSGLGGVRMIIDDNSDLGKDYPEGLVVGRLPEHVSGWSNFKFVFTKKDLEKALSRDGTPYWAGLGLLFDVRTLETTKLYIDDISLVNGYATLYPQTAMLDDLRNNKERVAIAGSTTGSAKMATMTVGGRDVSYFNGGDDPIKFASGALYGNSNLFLASEETFNPANNTNPQITPANGFRTWLHDINTGTRTPFPITHTGAPGEIFSDLSKPEQLAVSLAPGRISIAPNADRIAVAVSSANLNNARQIVGSPASFVEIYDLQGTNRIARIPGDFGILASDGKLAIANHEPGIKEYNVTLADKDGNIDKSRSFNFYARDMVWSPDNNQLAMIIRPSLGDFYNGSVGGSDSKYTGLYIYDYAQNSLSNPIILENGEDLKGLHWTKDGKYILYSVRTGKDNKTNQPIREIRWLNPVTSEIGVVTHNMSAVVASE